MTPETQPRIALLIDADNAPSEMIDEILTELSTFGLINIRRAYGNWTKPGLQGWQSKLLEYAVRPMQQFDYSKGKNATDMAMTVDAMELLYTEQPDAFGIVSSDADFTPLVMHLRAKGAAVYGFGAAQTPKAFANACSRFLYFEALAQRGDGITSRAERLGHDSPVDVRTEPAGAIRPGPGSVPAASGDGHRPGAGQTPGHANGDDTAPHPSAGDAPRGAQGGHSAHRQPAVPAGTQPGASEAAPATSLRVPPHQLRQDRQLVGMLCDAVSATQDESGWARVGAVGTHIGNKLSFDARNYGYATLTKLLAATQRFEVRDEGTARVAVRALRPGQ